MGPKRLLITGASGLVESDLTMACAQQGWQATGTWSSMPVNVAGARTARLDMGDGDACRSLAREVRPGVVIHAVASVQLSRLEQDTHLAELDVRGTENTVRAAEAVGARCLLVSSDCVPLGDRPAGEKWTEHDSTDPANAYGGSELASERIVQQARVPWLIMRPANVYGVNRSTSTERRSIEDHVRWRSSLGLRWLRLLQAGETITAPASVYQCPTFAWDYAERTYRLIAGGELSTWQLAGPLAIHRQAYLRSLAAAFDCDRGLVLDGMIAEFLRQGGDDPLLALPANTSPSDAKARSPLGPGVNPDHGHRLMREQLVQVLTPPRSEKEKLTWNSSSSTA